MFKPVSPKIDFPKLECDLLEKWSKNGIVPKYLHKNDSSSEKFRFLDGPITANNPMSAHHAWGRTYKDFWQRFKNMQGFKQRFQNGFDEQGLWVEVEVEKELGLKSKKDIENLIPGDKFKSLEKFINLCKERVKKYSAVQTEQSKRLGYFMDWENSYHTSSDQNNYAIWNFLKVVHDKGWLYKCRDSVPWCPRCGTAISQHEILTEEYKELTHESVFIEYPIVGRENEYFIAWTTTPWTLPANIALSVHQDYDYVVATGTKKGNKYYLLKESAERLKLNIEEVIKGKELVSLNYISPFDDLSRVKESLGKYRHQVIATDELILPISKEEGTGIVHIATGAGSEDFRLGKKYSLPVIEIIGEEANYLDGLGQFSQKNGKKHPELIIDFLKKFEGGKYLFSIEKYKHRYPTCWRCKTELVWRVVDEWYIAMDRKDKSGKTYREQMIETAKKIKWLPKWGLERELDWLQNMHDWLISKKRYWGLALPIWECQKCGNFEVVGSKEELKEKAAEGWNEFDDHTPHRPWVDQVKIKCSKCQELTYRIPDVGNPWLDAGIVSISTMPQDWFPADFITESFPGQFKNWFYSLIAMSTALKGANPTKTILGHGSVRDEKGEEMHKSKGNAIDFNEAAEKIGVDVMRWLYLRTNPEHNVNFGYHTADEIRRRFHLILWNIYNFFVNYANIDKWGKGVNSRGSSHILDKWIMSRLNQLIKVVTDSIENYDAFSASYAIEEFVNDFSTWYVRRSRDRVGPTVENSEDKNNCYETLWEVLASLCQLMAPFTPFIAEKIYQNLTNEESVHLSNWPTVGLINETLHYEMDLVRKICELGHAERKRLGIKVRQPLQKLKIKNATLRLRSGQEFKTTNQDEKRELEQLISDELNVKEVEWIGVKGELQVELDAMITPPLKAEGEARELVRQIQELRKKAGCTLDEKITVYAPSWPKDFEDYIKKQTLAESIVEGKELKIERKT